MNNKIDLISLEITWNSLKSIADESYITLMKSAFSTNIKERHDHSTAITNSDGKLIAQAENALPAHLASCLLYTSPSPRDGSISRMPSSA